MKKRFKIITVYDDCTSKSEYVSEIQPALITASIYWQDTGCVSITIYDYKTNSTILDYVSPD